MLGPSQSADILTNLADTEEFVASRLPLIRHALAAVGRAPPRPMTARQRESKYSFKQGFFYPVEHWLSRRIRPYCSVAALNHARAIGLGQAIFGLRRAAFARATRNSPNGSVLHFEHVYTGEMCWRSMLVLHESGRLDVAEVDALLAHNYCTAWILKSEVPLVPRSLRGSSLVDALGFFDSAGIPLVVDDKLRPALGHRQTMLNGGASASRHASLEVVGDVLSLCVRLGFVVAGADGLDEAERRALMEYAVDRCGLSSNEVVSQIGPARDGMAGFSRDEWSRLRTLGPGNLDSILADIAAAAAADGKLSKEEEAVLSSVRKELSLPGQRSRKVASDD